MTITYEYGSNLYINITNKCPNDCDFCIRTQADGYYTDDLWLENEPSPEEILSDIKCRDMESYDSVVFCGYGEPTERLDTMLKTAEWIKANFPALPIRLNTNGQSDLINKKPTARLFEGLFDTVSISLNAGNADAYDDVCHSRFGKSAFESIISFSREVKNYVPNVIFSVVSGSVSEDEIESCKRIASENGIPLRIREYIKNN